jgi:hypothetical protein
VMPIQVTGPGIRALTSVAAVVQPTLAAGDFGENDAYGCSVGRRGPTGATSG